MPEKIAAFVLCLLIFLACISIILITLRGYNRKASKASGVQVAGNASGPVKRPTKKRRSKKRRGRR
jgi:hypothetical protein